AFEQRLNLSNVVPRLLRQGGVIPIGGRWKRSGIVAPGSQRGDAVVGSAPERLVIAQRRNQRQQNLANGLAQRGSGRRGGLRPPDLPDWKLVRHRFRSQPEIDGESRGILSPDVPLEAVRGKAS